MQGLYSHILIYSIMDYWMYITRGKGNQIHVLMWIYIYLYRDCVLLYIGLHGLETNFKRVYGFRQVLKKTLHSIYFNIGMRWIRTRNYCCWKQQLCFDISELSCMQVQTFNIFNALLYMACIWFVWYSFFQVKTKKN